MVPGEASPPASWPGVVEELAVQEVDELKEEPKPETLKEKPEDSEDPKAADAKNRASAKSAAESADGTKNRESAVSAKTAKSEEGGRTYGRSSNPSRKGWERRMRSSGASFRASSHSKASAATNPAPGGGTRAPPPVAVDPESKIPVAQCRQVVLVPVLPKGTGYSKSSRHSGQTVLSAISRMTRLSQAGEDFRHHFGTAQTLQPQIAGAMGAKAALRDDVETWDADGISVEGEGPTKRASIPKDVRLPAFLIVLSCFCNTASYTIEFATFAIFFKQVHNWNAAIWASLAQTAGDVRAAIAMQIIPAIFPDNFEEDEAGPIKRFFHYIVSQPYTLTTPLVTWVLFNAQLIHRNHDQNPITSQKKIHQE